MAVDRAARIRPGGLEREDLEHGTRGALGEGTGEPQVTAADPHAGDARHALDPLARQVALGRDERTAEHVDVELRE